MITGERIIVGIAAVVVVLLQVLVAPHIAIGYAVPNFIAAFCLAIAVARSESSGPVMPFVLGLIFDLVSGGPVGAMAFALPLLVTLESWLFERMNNDTLFMVIAVVGICLFLVEFIYGMVFLLFGYSAGFIEAFVYRILPCFVYDFVLALIAYAGASRFLGGDTVTRTEIKQL